MSEAGGKEIETKSGLPRIVRYLILAVLFILTVIVWWPVVLPPDHERPEIGGVGARCISHLQ